MADKKNHHESLNVEEALSVSEAFIVKHKTAIIGFVAGADDPLLHGRQAGQGAFDAEIPPGHHDDVGDGQDFLQPVHGVLAFQLGADGDVAPRRLDQRPGFKDVFRGLHIG